MVHCVDRCCQYVVVERARSVLGSALRRRSASWRALCPVSLHPSTEPFSTHPPLLLPPSQERARR
eukprot:9431562-Pyramimonas_sp.AAC.1